MPPVFDFKNATESTWKFWSEDIPKCGEEFAKRVGNMFKKGAEAAKSMTPPGLTK
jgi:hypothetical protein